MPIGVISDTHGLLCAVAVAALRGSDLILHAGYAAVIVGQSHRPTVETRDGVLFLNPGSAGPRGFTLPVTVARLAVADGRLTPEILTLPV